jgi:hypothetical protein
MGLENPQEERGRMAIIVDLEDKPADIPDWKCLICGKPFLVTHYQILGKWIHPAVHDRCGERFYKEKNTIRAPELKIPERFAHFDQKQGNAEAMSLCAAFSHESKVKTLAIIGTPHKGKSRLLWMAVKSFFNELGHGWVEAFGFEELMAEFDKGTMQKIATSRYVLVDDVGCVESYGRERAALQAALRARIKNNLWTFLSVDSISFDPGLESILKDRALMVVL